MRHILLFFLACIFLRVYSQPEICNNCIDDDGDGLIDCYDTECNGSPLCDNFIVQVPDVNCLSFATPTINAQILWQDNSTSVFGEQTPFVADIDADGIPEIILTDGTKVHFYNGKTGAVKQTITLPNPENITRHSISIGDIDHDGFGEIIFKTNMRIRCYEHDGTLKWSKNLTLPFTNNPSYTYLADFNGDGDVELYLSDRIMNALTGDLLDTISMPFNQYWAVLAADVLDSSATCPDCNGLEFIKGNKVYSVNIISPDSADMTLRAVAPGGVTSEKFSAVADWNNDGKLDIIVTDNLNSEVYVWDPRIPALLTATYSAMGSLACVADFDNDGQLELVMERNVSVPDKRLLCLDNDLSVKWEFAVNDVSSGYSTPTAFDFDCDNIPEIVFRDETFLMIVRGSDGTKLYTTPCSNGTASEHMTVADVNGDGAANIVVTTVGSYGVKVYESSGNPWPPTRKVMNQQVYIATNINDDLTIPCHQQNHAHDSIPWANAFLNQPTLLDEDGECFILINPFDSLGLSIGFTDNSCFKDSVVFTSNSTLSIDSVIWYFGNGDSSTLENPKYLYSNSGKHEITFIGYKACLNPDTITDTITLFRDTTYSLADIFLCPGTTDTIGIHSIPGSTYNWVPSNGLSDPAISNPVAGPDSTTLYTLYAQSNCTDTIYQTVTIHSLPTISLNPIDTIYLGDTLLLMPLGGNNIDSNYSWYPTDYLDCFICRTPLAYPPQTITYFVNYIDSNGCLITTSKMIVVLEQQDSIYENSLFIPNAFSPDGDDNNDKLVIKGNNIEQLHVSIYDHYGNKVYETLDITSTFWDGTKNGKILTQNIFTYNAMVRFIDGSTLHIIGNTTLIK